MSDEKPNVYAVEVAKIERNKIRFRARKELLTLLTSNLTKAEDVYARAMMLLAIHGGGLQGAELAKKLGVGRARVSGGCKQFRSAIAMLDSSVE